MQTNRGVSRRCFLAASGTAVALSSPAGSFGARAAQDEYYGKLVFTYDDSPAEDYTKTFPIHQDEGVPGCVAAVSERLDTEDWLPSDHLREMEDAGWEVMSHTKKHRAMGTLPVTENVEEGDTKIYTVSYRYGAHPGDPVRIFDEEKHVIATAAGQGTDDVGEYVTLEEPIEESFVALESEIRYTDERIRTSLGESKEQLEEYGFDVSGFVLPYDINGTRVSELLPEYYDAVANTRWDGDGLNQIQFLDPHELHRTYFREGQMTEAELGSYLDDVARRDVLGILGGHSQYEELTEDRIRAAIQMAKERNIEILTLRDALADLGFVESTATPTPEDDGSEPTETDRTSTTEAAPTSSPDVTTEEPTAGTSGQAGFGVTTAIAGAGLLAWNRLRD